ncbi:MAG: PA14 domain-containing protein [Elusimicrobiota bacterium]
MEPFKIKELKKNISSIKKSSQTLYNLYESGDYKSCLIIGKGIFEGLDNLMEQMKSTSENVRIYLNMAFEQKMPHFSEDKDIFLKFDLLSTESLGKNLKAALLRLSQNIDTISNQVDIISPPRSLFKENVLPHLLKWKSPLIGSVLIFSFIGFYRVISRIQYNNKHSLKVEYFLDTELKSSYKIKNDPKIDFKWGNISPIFGFKEDSFSIRWSGFINVPTKGQYDFSVESDDGSRMWINGEQIINDWTSRGWKQNTARIELNEGLQKIVVEYFDDYAEAGIKLSWKRDFENEYAILEQNYFINESYAKK